MDCDQIICHTGKISVSWKRWQTNFRQNNFVRFCKPDEREWEYVTDKLNEDLATLENLDKLH